MLSNFILGGESEALKRMKEKLSNVSWVCSFEKPKTSPNSLAPSTTLLSPYLKFGCLSVRTFYHEILTVCQNSKMKYSQPPESLLGIFFEFASVFLLLFLFSVRALSFLLFHYLFFQVFLFT